MSFEDSSSAFAGAQLLNASLCAVALLGVVVYLVVGTFFLEPDMIADLRNARALWESNAPNQYSYRVHRVCLCGPEGTVPYTVSVDSARTTVDISERDRSGYGVDRISATDVLTIQRVFELVESAVGDADRMSVEFNEFYGYPHVVSIDWSTDIIDDEYDIRIEGFQIVANGI